MLQQVLSHGYKAEISAIAAELASGAQSGSRKHFSSWTRAMEIFKANMSAADLAAAEAERTNWQQKGVPVDVQRMNAMKYGQKTLADMANAHFKNIGMRKLVWEYHDNIQGKALFSM